MQQATRGSRVALLGTSGSPFVGSVAHHLEAAGVPHCTLSLDAPLEGKPVTICPESVFWEGMDLLSAGVVFAERLVFPWPQAGLPPGPLRANEDVKGWVMRWREAVSLAWSALLVVAEARPVVNPPSANHLAVSPSVALDRLAARGVAVHPWRIEPAPARDASALVADACGRDRWYEPEVPANGEPAIVFDPFPGELVKCMVVGGEIVGRVPPRADAARLAVEATSTLGLGFAAVTVCTGDSGSSVVMCEAAPDLAAWDRESDGHLATAMALYLARLASEGGSAGDARAGSPRR